MGATVDVEIGATIPLADYSNLKARIAFNGLDPDQEIEPQLERLLVVVATASKRIDEKLEEVIVQTTSVAAGRPGINDRLEQLEQAMTKRRENEQKIAAKVKELIGQIAPAIQEAVTPTAVEPSAEASAAEAPAKRGRKG